MKRRFSGLSDNCKLFRPANWPQVSTRAQHVIDTISGFQLLFEAKQDLFTYLAWFLIKRESGKTVQIMK